MKRPRLPAVTERVWRAFWQIEKRGRSGNGFSALPVSNLEVDAWCRLRGERLMQWELDALDQMEGVRLSLLNGAEPEAPAKLTPALFKGMFGK